MPDARRFPVIARAIGCVGSADWRHDEAVARLRRAVADNDRDGAGPQAAIALVLLHAARRADALGVPALAADAGRLLADAQPSPRGA